MRNLLRYLGWIDRKPGDMWPFPFAAFKPRPTPRLSFQRNIAAEAARHAFLQRLHEAYPDRVPLPLEDGAPSMVGSSYPADADDIAPDGGLPEPLLAQDWLVIEDDDGRRLTPEEIARLPADTPLVLKPRPVYWFGPGGPEEIKVGVAADVLFQQERLFFATDPSAQPEKIKFSEPQSADDWSTTRWPDKATRFPPA